MERLITWAQAQELETWYRRGGPLPARNKGRTRLVWAQGRMWAVDTQTGVRLALPTCFPRSKGEDDGA